MKEETGANGFKFAIFFLLMLAVSVNIALAYYREVGVYLLFYQIGYLVSTTLTVSCVLYFVLKHLMEGLTQYKGLWFSFAVLFFIFSCTLTPVAYEQHVQMNNTMQAFSRLFKYELAGQISHENYSYDEYGEQAVLLEGLKALSINQCKELTQYNQFVDASLNQALSPEVFYDYDKLERSISILKEMKAVTDEVEAKILSNVAESYSKMGKLQFSDKQFQTALIGGVEKGINEGKQFWGSLFGNKKKTFSEFEKLLNFLARNYGSYWEEDGVICFSNDMNSCIYNSCIERISKLEMDEGILLKNQTNSIESVAMGLDKSAGF